MKFLTVLAEGLRLTPVNIRAQIVLALAGCAFAFMGLYVSQSYFSLANTLCFLSLLFGLRNQEIGRKRFRELCKREEQEFRELVRRQKAACNDTLRNLGLPPMED